MSASFFRLLLLLATCPVLAQQPADTIAVPKRERYGLRVGVDLFKLSRTFWEKDYRGLELTGDYRLTRKYYAVAEIGNENKTTIEDRLDFTTKGSYLRVGFDYNTHNNWLNLENMIYVGLRYGFSSFSQTLNSYGVYTPNPYWEEGDVVTSGKEYDGLTAHWAEAVVGLKTQVLPNVFVGFSFRMNRLFGNKEPEGFQNLYIPGYNRVYSGEFGVGMNYTVSYFIPLYKKTVRLTKEAADEKAKAKK